MNSSFNDIKTNEMLIQQQLDSVISELKIEKKQFLKKLIRLLIRSYLKLICW